LGRAELDLVPKMPGVGVVLVLNSSLKGLLGPASRVIKKKKKV
jgi:hypothetical protein